MKKFGEFLWCIYSAALILLSISYFKDINFENPTLNNLCYIIFGILFLGGAIWYIVDLLINNITNKETKEKEIYKYRNPNILYLFYIQDLTTDEEEILQNIFRDNCQGGVFLYKDIIYRRKEDIITHCKIETYLYLQTFKGLNIERERIITYSIILD